MGGDPGTAGGGAAVGGTASGSSAGGGVGGGVASGAGVGGVAGSLSAPAQIAQQPQQQQETARPYSLRGIYFRRDMFSGTADCLTAAHAQHLPPELCQ